jgi:hypothetical protein
VSGFIVGGFGTSPSLTATVNQATPAIMPIAIQANIIGLPIAIFGLAKDVAAFGRQDWQVS